MASDILKPGDLIEIKRSIYQHWALYLGDGYVIHLTTLDGDASPRFVNSPSVARKKAVARKQLLKDVVGNDYWHVNNKYDSRWTPLPVEEIIQHAESHIDQEVTYFLLGNNCEHFVTTLRYGEGFSGQVWKGIIYVMSFVGTAATAEIVRGAGLAAGLAIAASSAAGGAAAGAAIGAAIIAVAGGPRAVKAVAQHFLSTVRKKRKNV